MGGFCNQWILLPSWVFKLLKVLEFFVTCTGGPVNIHRPNPTCESCELYLALILIIIFLIFKHVYPLRIICIAPLHRMTPRASELLRLLEKNARATRFKYPPPSYYTTFFNPQCRKFHGLSFFQPPGTYDTTGQMSGASNPNPHPYWHWGHSQE